MILSAREIQVLVGRGVIGLDPLPTESTRWASTTVDLTLAAELRPWQPIASVGEDTTIDPMSSSFNSNALIERHTTPHDCTGGFVIKSHQLVLGWTEQRLRLPHEARIGARVEGKSSLARIGIGVHITAPTIHPGFGAGDRLGSSIRLEIWNAGPLAIRLTKGMAICQLIFEEVHGTPVTGYAGQFQTQGPEPPPRTSRRGRR